LFGGRARFGGVDGHGESGFGDHVDAFVGKLQIAHDMVVEVFGASPVVADVVGAPAAAEFLAACGQRPDEVVQTLVIGVAAGFGPQDGQAGVGGGVPVRVEAV
jgi:hypothetical protein